MVKAEKFDHLLLVHHFTIPLTTNVLTVLHSKSTYWFLYDGDIDR